MGCGSAAAAASGGQDQGFGVHMGEMAKEGSQWGRGDWAPQKWGSPQIATPGGCGVIQQQLLEHKTRALGMQMGYEAEEGVQ